MVDVNFKDFFEKLSCQTFNFLVKEFDFVFTGTQTPGFGAFSTFKNSTTRIEVWWDIRDNYVNVIITPLFLDNNTIPKEGVYLDDILRFRAPNIKLEHKIPGDVLVVEPMETILSKFSESLKKYGNDLLKGDLSILYSVYEKKKNKK